MYIRLIQVGKTEDPYLAEGIQKYTSRLAFYTSFEMVTIPKTNLSMKTNDKIIIEKSKYLEAEAILKGIGIKDYTVVLDENGREYSSIQFSHLIEQFLPLGEFSGFSRLNFVIGGPFGFSPRVMEKAKLILSLSKMTFSHQMIRLFMVEQIYRAFTIIKNEPYHHS